MRFSLARWEDEHGDSAGYWLVRGLPGFFLERDLDGSWQLQCFTLPAESPFAGSVMQAPCDTWGVDWSPEYDLFAALPRGVVGPHSTRASALFALESYLSPAPVSAVGDLL